MYNVRPPPFLSLTTDLSFLYNLKPGISISQSNISGVPQVLVIPIMSILLLLIKIYETDTEFCTGNLDNVL